MSNEENELIKEFYKGLDPKFAEEIKAAAPPKQMPHVEKINMDSIFHKVEYLFEEAEPVEFAMDDEDLADILNSRGQLIYGNRVMFLYRKHQFYDQKNSFNDINNPYYMPNPYYHLCNCHHLQDVVPQRSVHHYFAYTDRHSGAFPCEVTDNVTRYPSSFKYKKIAFLRVCPACFDDLRLANRGYNKEKFDLERYYREELTRLHNRKNDFKKGDEEKIRGDEYLFIRKEIADYAKAYYGYCCSECGKKCDHLEIHHKDKNPQNNSIDNLAVLCKECHDRHHPNRPGANNGKYKNKHR